MFRECGISGVSRVPASVARDQRVLKSFDYFNKLKKNLDTRRPLRVVESVFEI